MPRTPADTNVVPRFFKHADLETQAVHLASALVSATCKPPHGPEPGTFGYEWLNTARYFLEQQ